MRLYSYYLVLFGRIAGITRIQYNLLILVAFKQVWHLARVENIVNVLQELLLNDLAVNQQKGDRLVFNLKGGKRVKKMFFKSMGYNNFLGTYARDSIEDAQILMEGIEIVVASHLDLPAVVFVNMRG